MTTLNLPPCPASLKAVQHYLKIGAEHDTRDPVVAYWSRLTALQTGLTLDKSSKEALAVLLPLMEWLEKVKGERKDNEAITNEVVASAHVENYAMKLFLAADQADRAANFGKNVVKSFYSAGILFDVMQTFGELTPEVAHYRKYAKMKAAYIHNCLKNGETPIAGPLVGGDDEEGEEPADTFTSPPGGFVPPPGAGAPPPHYEAPPPHYEAPPPTTVDPNPPSNQFAAMELTQPGNSSSLSHGQISKVQKLCKYAISALDYQDTPTAIENLTKALHLCKTGQELT